ncbi:bleomycin resistance protein [Chitinophaga deserti]|uniref:bleomycin resistance protein n=1 Tax=Chitinophaga deserti TaxID=2164099 RepID=UPI000D6D13F9|nr:VOC family protein [Chitinophaga deserti]
MNRMIPILPCKDLDELLAFYCQIGFEVTYRQKSPNLYATVEKDWMRLDFYGISHHDPKKTYHTCYILTEATDELYETFTAGMRKSNGKLPTRGLPRISEIRDKAYGVREFMFSDPAGNCIRIGRKLVQNASEESDRATTAAAKRLALVLDYAYRFEDDEGEYDKLPGLLDKAIERDKEYPCDNLFKVMNLRADYAIRLGDLPLAKQLLAAVKTHPLMADREKFYTVLQRVADLEAIISGQENI